MSTIQFHKCAGSLSPYFSWCIGLWSICGPVKPLGGRTTQCVLVFPPYCSHHLFLSEERERGRVANTRTVLQRLSELDIYGLGDFSVAWSSHSQKAASLSASCVGPSDERVSATTVRPRQLMHSFSSPFQQLSYTHCIAMDYCSFLMLTTLVKDWKKSLRGLRSLSNFLFLNWSWFVHHLISLRSSSAGIMPSLWSRNSWFAAVLGSVLVVLIAGNAGPNRDRGQAGSSSCFGGFDLYFVLDKWVAWHIFFCCRWQVKAIYALCLLEAIHFVGWIRTMCYFFIWSSVILRYIHVQWMNLT